MLTVVTDNFDAKINDVLRIYGSGGWICLSDSFRRLSIELQNKVLQEMKLLKCFDDNNHSSGYVIVENQVFRFRIRVSKNEITEAQNRDNEIRIMSVFVDEEQASHTY